ARMPVIAIDASVTYCKYLWANLKHSPALFGNVQFVWGYAGAAGDSGRVTLGAGTASSTGTGSAGIVESAPRVGLATLAENCDVSLLKTDTDGFDQDII